MAEGGLVTAGNSSGLNDGGVAIVVMSRKKADELGFDLSKLNVNGGAIVLGRAGISSYLITKVL
jgi:acetyl-CoA acetyltransferase